MGYPHANKKKIKSRKIEGEKRVRALSSADMFLISHDHVSDMSLLNGVNSI